MVHSCHTENNRISAKTAQTVTKIPKIRINRSLPLLCRDSFVTYLGDTAMMMPIIAMKIVQIICNIFCIPSTAYLFSFVPVMDFDDCISMLHLFLPPVNSAVRSISVGI